MLREPRLQRPDHRTATVLGLTTLCLLVLGLLVQSNPADALSATPVQLRDKAAGVRLLVDSGDISPGDTIEFRLQNHTKVNIYFGASFGVEMYQGTGWVPASFTPQGPWPAYLAYLKAGRTGGWEDLSIPADATPGLYRIKKTIEIRSLHRVVTVPFEVQG